MKLIIAEKPSVAAAIAAAIGTPSRKPGYLESGGHLISWCVGHLVELADPEKYDPKWKSWRLEDLPIIPVSYITEVSGRTAQQFKVLQSLMGRTDITELIEATDAGREGELIFRLVYQKANCRKPFSRLWISSVEPEAICAGLQSLHPAKEYDNLFAAAQGRQKADWLLGINLTRLYTTLYHTRLPYGRVQTPTINLIVCRQEEIDLHVPQKYYSICSDLGGFRAYTRTNHRAAALQMIEQCTGAEAQVTRLQETRKTEKAPALYDLTALQRDANRRYGYTAQQTLDVAQSLYEAALITYPRTDSRYILSSQADAVSEIIKILINQEIEKSKNREIEKMRNQYMIAQIINDKKVTDHHAILPTKAAITADQAALPTAEKNILYLLQQRLLAAVAPPHIYTAVTTTLDIEGYPFQATGRREIDLGWRGMEAQDAVLEDETENHDMPPLAEGNAYTVVTCTMAARQTKPPAAYTEDTLLKAMETAGQEIEDPLQREAMKNRGLGTPATRAGIIENIIRSGYIQRSGKQLLPTPLAKKFIALVDPRLKSPQLTAQWEFTLAQIQQGCRNQTSFLRELEAFLRPFVREAKELHLPEDAEIFREPIGSCPCCGQSVYDTPKAYSCQGGEGCGFLIWKKTCGKQLSKSQIEKLLNTGQTDVIQGFTSKAGKSFDAALQIVDGKLKFVFS